MSTDKTPVIVRSRLLRTAWLTAATLALWGSGLAAVQAQMLADVSIVERASGRVLPVYRHGGELWVAGRPGASYAVRIRNTQGQRIMGVVSVDGVNAITGKTASSRASGGYVLEPGQSYDINGWRKSNDNVAAFYFSESDMSYAARTGRPQDVGVIGVALFREKPQEIAYDAPAHESSRSAAESSATDMAAPNAAQKSSRSAEKRMPAAPQPAPSLGTGHGAIERSQVSTVDFESATARPEQIVRIRYDSRANLVAKGVIREHTARPPIPRQPRPFPADEGFVPDPPRD